MTSPTQNAAYAQPDFVTWQMDTRHGTYQYRLDVIEEEDFLPASEMHYVPRHVDRAEQGCHGVPL